MRIPLASLGSVLVFVAACGGTTVRASGGAGGSSGAGRSSGAGGASGTGGAGGGATTTTSGSMGEGGSVTSGGNTCSTCNSVALENDTNEVNGTGAPPAMTGGTIVDGTWVMIEQTVYHPVADGDLGGGPPIAETQKIMGSVLLYVYEINGGGPEGGFSTANYGSLTTNGNHLTAKTTCGCEPDLDVTYTTDGVTLQELTPPDSDDYQWLTVFKKM